ncbi:IclR family transcriptional regulator [Azohydromonas australica]|uniref:IclR family transcriptional regulator n=1 Tax=Azohydromonas australica TaxID=364039 RepID=UPI00040B95D1|nr:IclR family transcriptional regulator [Azohydromonas australica]
MSAVPALHGDAAALLTVSRGLAVLRAFRSDGTPVSNTELARRTGLPKATVSRLTSTLLQLGFIRRVPGGREFELTAGAYGMGHALVAASELVRTAEPVMQTLADRLQASVALAMPDGLDMLYVAYRAGYGVATLRLGRGTVLPMATTAIGHAYLGGLDEPERRRQLDRLTTVAGDDAQAIARGIARSLADLAAQGACTVLGGYQRDVGATAVPLRVGRRAVLMGMSCGKASLQIDVELDARVVVPAIKDAAVELQERLAPLDGLL